MAGTMSEADLVADLQGSLQDAANAFTAASSADFKRHLKAAALAFSRKRRRTLTGTLTLVADQAQYACPDALVAFKSALWGLASTIDPRPWEKSYPGRLPDAVVVEASGVRKIELRPAPTAAQISQLGSEYRYYYFAGHEVGADAAQTTIHAGERQLLLLRAQAEAMRELAARNIVKPMAVRDGLTQTPRNGTPSYLYHELLAEFEAA